MSGPNDVRRQLSVLAYNLGNLWRRLGAASADRHLVVISASSTQARFGWCRTRPIKVVKPTMSA